VLIDDSRSLKVNGKDTAAWDNLQAIFDKGNDIKVFSFSDNIKLINQPDSFQANGPHTNLTNAIEHLRTIQIDEPVNSLSIISDGNFNMGGNPLYSAKTLSCPVITAPLGDSIQDKDIILYTASHNNTSYINTKTPVNVFVKAYGTGNDDIKIRLEREGAQITEKTVPVNQGENSYSLLFEITEGTPGKYHYKIIAENKEGEVTYKNNHYDFYIEFFDNKIKLLFISGGPSYDNAIVSSILKRINNFEVTVKTLKGPTEFYEGNIDPHIYGNLSAIMFLNFPSSKYSGRELEDINSNSKKFNIPLIFFAGRNTDFKKLELASGIIPFTITQPSGSESSVRLQSVSDQKTGQNNLPQDITFNLSNVPELNRNFSGVQPKAGAVTLAVDKNSGEPVLITRKDGNITSTAFLAYGFWKWKLKSDNEKQIEEIIEKAIRISLSKSKNKRLIVTPVKEFFDYSEDVLIQAEAYDDNNNLTIDASLKGIIKDKNGIKIKDLSFTVDKNKFIANCGKLPVSDYFIEAEAEINRSVYANDMNRLTIDTLNTEYLQTTSDYEVLRELANNTGGTFTSINNLLETMSNTHNTNISSKTNISSRINLRENIYFLFLIILLFTSEWVIKKRNNIP
ncbi:MAG TPA: hypothetical protein VGK25_05355, partial [Ignavibacteria bacterium]